MPKLTIGVFSIDYAMMKLVIFKEAVGDCERF